MPSSGYSQFLQYLEDDFTVFRYDAFAILDNRTLRHLSDAVFNGEPFGYIGHSSLLPSLITTDAINGAVLLDPSAFPRSFDAESRKWQSQTVTPSCPVLVCDAEYTRCSDMPFVPSGFNLVVKGAEIHRFSGVGHADILNDNYADACSRLGIRGCKPSCIARETRQRYRQQVARRVIQFL